MAIKYFDAIGQVTATTGTVTVTLGAQIGSNFFTFAEQGGASGDQVFYRIDEGGDVEIGLGTLGASAGVLSRDTVLKSRIGGASGTTKMTLAGSAQVRCVQSSVALGVDLRGYLAGLTLSNNAVTPNTQLDVTAGVATDDTGARSMALASGTINLATTGANALDTGALANNSTYHIFAISKADGTVSRLASLSPTAPTLPSGYTLKRRIGAVLTNGSAQVLGFAQVGNEFLLKAIVKSLDGYALPTSAYIATLKVPTGVQVGALVTLGLIYGGNSGYVLMSSPDQDDVVPSGVGGYNTLVNAGLTFSSDTPGPLRTNSSGQIRLRSNQTTITADVFTRGWVDYI